MKLVCTTGRHAQHQIDLSSLGWTKIVMAVGKRNISPPESLHSLKDGDVIKSGDMITVLISHVIHVGRISWLTDVVLNEVQTLTLLTSRHGGKSRPVPAPRRA